MRILSTTPHKITEESIKLLNELQQSNIRFCNWKGNSHLVESLEGKTDIELLVYPEDRYLFEAVMNKLAFKKLDSRPWSNYPHIEDWLGFDYETGNLLHLHTHYAVATGDAYGQYLYLPWTEVFFQHLITEKQTGWPIPKPELEAIVLLIRMGAKKLQKPKSKYLRIPGPKQDELIGLLQQANIDHFKALCQELKLEVPQNLEARIERIVCEKEIPEIIALSEYFYQHSPVSHDKNTSRKGQTGQYSRLYQKALHRLNRFIGPLQLKKTLASGGKVIALIGSDGSGKSTLSKDLIEWLTFKVDTHLFYLGKRPFIRSYNKRLFLKTDLIANDTYFSELLKKLLGDAYYVMMIRQKFQLLLLARNMCRKGSIILCDRFPQQSILGFNDGPKLQKKKTRHAKQEIKWFNRIKDLKADLVIRLKVSAKIASLRKPEHDYEMIRKKCEHIDKISFSGTLTLDIDANKPYNQVLLEAKRAIWNAL